MDVALPMPSAAFVPPNRLLTNDELRTIPGLRLGSRWEHYASGGGDAARLLCLRLRVSVAPPVPVASEPEPCDGGETPLRREDQQRFSGGRTPLQSQDEQRLDGGQTPSAGQSPLDERLAVLGYCPKLLQHLTPDLWELASALEELRRSPAVTELSLGERAGVLTNGYIVLRLVRGAAAQRWLSEVLGRLCLTFLSVCSGGVEHTSCMRAVGKVVLREYDGHCTRCDLPATWGAHGEKHHAMFSGRATLVALDSPDGSSGAAAAASALLPLVFDLLRHGGQTPYSWSQDDCVLALTACYQNVVLRTDATASGTNKSMRAGWYNSVNAGWGFLAWSTVARLADWPSIRPHGPELPP